MGATERAALDQLVRELRRRGEDPVRRAAHPPARQGLAVPPRHRLRHGVRRLVEPLPGRPARRAGVERPAVQVATPALLDKFDATFDTYWNDASFEPYDPDRTATGSTTRSRGLGTPAARPGHDQPVRARGPAVPVPAGDARGARRRADVHDRHRNLVVAATGTGKTVVAALDYRRLCAAQPSDRPSLLFVAHRKEILEQSLRTYREVLADGTFGELYVGGARPERWRPRLRLRPVPDCVRRHEHPARRLRRRRHRRVPPRRGADLPPAARPPAARASCSASPRRPNAPTASTSAPFFDGRTAAELRLWDALDADLLCPFHYFGVADGADLRRIELEARPVRRAELIDRLHRQRRPGRDRPRATARQGHRPWARCGRSASASPSPTPTSWPRRSPRPASPRSRVTGDTPAARARSAPLQRPASRDESTSSSPSTCSTRASTCPRSTRCCSSGPPRAPPSSSSSSVAGCAARRDKAVLTVLDFVGHQRQEFRFDKRSAR